MCNDEAAFGALVIPSNERDRRGATSNHDVIVIVERVF
jgi:hypothetical protein